MSYALLTHAQASSWIIAHSKHEGIFFQNGLFPKFNNKLKPNIL
jgi:hypothetical protein